jgi:hypothetical protein
MDSRELLLHMSVFAALAVTTASSLFVLQPLERAILLFFLTLLFLREVHELAYAEFVAAGRALWGGGIWHWLRRQIDLCSLERELARAQSPEQVWTVLRAAADPLGVGDLEVRLGTCYWREALSPSSDGAWRVSLDLGPNSSLAFTVKASGSLGSGEFAAVARDALNARKLAAILPATAPELFEPPEAVALDRCA